MAETSPLFDSPSQPLPDGLLTVVVPPLQGEYLYCFDANEFQNLQIGDLIEVSFRNRSTQAFVLSINSDRERVASEQMSQQGVTIKKITLSGCHTRAFDASHLPFYHWIADYYVEPLSRILELAVPKPAMEKPQRAYTLCASAYDSSSTPENLGKVQKAILEALKSASHPIEASRLRRQSNSNSSSLRSLVSKGLIKEVQIEKTIPDNPFSDLPPPTPLELNKEQRAASDSIVKHIDSSSFVAGLLHGVTGSGKTEVYLSLIMRALAQNKSALVVVPEIALTPQLTERFVSRLQTPVAVLHSNLKPKERWRHWTDLLSGRVKVAIGARSAVFAPILNLGIIIVDEEHDSSLKQGDGIRYHGRDLAVVRAQLSSCPIVLGSATPSLETFRNAQTKKYLYLPLTNKFFSAPSSRCTIVDLNQIKPWEMKSKNISPEFYSQLDQALATGHQAFVLYNKRGFASYLQCSCCEYVLGCPHCSVTLTYHRNENLVLCHQCNFSLLPPGICNQCGGTKHPSEEDSPVFTQRGAGTERVFDELQELFPSARLATLDRDSASTLQDYVDILTSVRERKVDILVGTQMIAKGHDLPGVNFVGIVDCDIGLHMPDFRAGERSLQLLTQVAGRAGRRSIPGKVVLQTRVPSHPSLLATASSDFNTFADQELIIRQTMGYPPFHKVLRIIAAATDQQAAQQKIAAIAQDAQRLLTAEDMVLLGPAAAPLEKVRTLWRFHLLIKAVNLSHLHRVMRALKRLHPSNSKARIAYDLDPHDML